MTSEGANNALSMREEKNEREGARSSYSNPCIFTLSSLKLKSESVVVHLWLYRDFGG